MNFILGTILGAYFLFLIKMSIDSKKIYRDLVEPLDNFIDSPISDYTFIDRKNDIVNITFTSGDNIMIRMDKKTVNILDEDQNLFMYRSKENSSRIDFLYNKLITGFKIEIFDNITVLNGYTISNNLIVVKDQDDNIVEDVSVLGNIIPTIDEILEKISKSGIDSLTKDELDILKG